MATPVTPPAEQADMAELRKSSASSGMITFGAQIAKLAINGIGIILLARLLPPADHGLVALVLAITGFFLIFRDAGLPAATIQAHEINHGQLTNVFWINLALSSLVALVLALLAPAVAWFYNDGRLLLITIVLALPFIISGASSQHIAILKRRLKFGRIAVVEVGGALTANVLGVTTALLGAGYWSIVLVPVAFSAVSSSIAWALSGWRPGRPQRGFAIREVVRFGAHITAFDVVNYFARNADKLLIAKVFGAASVGVYAKAYQLFLLPLSQIKGPAVSVALPAMSRLQKQPEQFRAYYIRLVEVLAFSTIPLAGFLFVAAEPLIRILLGPTWMGVLPILQILALGGLMQSVETTRGVVMLSLGQSGKYLRYGICRSIYTVASFIVGLRWGPAGVAAAYVIAGYVALLPSLAYTFKDTPIRVSDFVKAIAPSLGATLASIAIISYVSSRIALGDIAFLVLAAVASAVLNLALLALIPQGRSIIRRMYAYIGFGLSGLSGSYQQPLLAVRKRINLVKRIRAIQALCHRCRVAATKPTLPPVAGTRPAYSATDDPGLKAWTIQDERWSRVVHRTEHRGLVKRGHTVVVDDDSPDYAHPDLHVEADGFAVRGEGSTRDEWFYMFLEPRDYDLADFRWRFRFRRDSDFREIQFGIRYRDFYNRYRFRIEEGFLFFDVVEGGEFTNALGRVPCHLEIGRWYDVQIDAVGNHFAFSLDGQQRLLTVDFKNRFPRGSVAIILWDNSAIPVRAAFSDLALDSLSTTDAAIAARVPAAA
jgi:polysaccharide transporter, PST family